MPYEDYYILIGNRDITIRMDSNQIDSCFGSQASLFRPSSQYTADNILFFGKGVSKG